MHSIKDSYLRTKLPSCACDLLHRRQSEQRAFVRQGRDLPASHRLAVIRFSSFDPLYLLRCHSTVSYEPCFPLTSLQPSPHCPRCEHWMTVERRGKVGWSRKRKREAVTSDIKAALPQSPPPSIPLLLFYPCLSSRQRCPSRTEHRVLCKKEMESRALQIFMSA